MPGNGVVPNEGVIHPLGKTSASEESGNFHFRADAPVSPENAFSRSFFSCNNLENLAARDTSSCCSKQLRFAVFIDLYTTETDYLVFSVSWFCI